MKKSGITANSKILLIVLLIIFLVFVLELSSKGALHFILGVNDSDYAHHYREDPKLSLITWTEGYTPHPYFGYESSTTIRSEKILEQRTDSEFIIGILGGSVAGSFAEYSIRNQKDFESLREAIPALRQKKLRIVNLANGGFKQPQQFFVAAYFVDKLDLIINVDGLNDAQPGHLLPVYPLEFPNFPQFYGRANQSSWSVGLGRTARWLYKKINHAPLAIPGLSHSSFYFLWWYNFHDHLYRIVKWSEAAYYTNEFLSHQSEDLRKTDPKEFINKRIAIWKRYTVLEDDLVRKRSGKPVFFYLQPNQYLKDSKPFSEQEKQIALDPSLAETYHGMMVSLKSAAGELRSSGIPISDLTAIFSRTNETVYKDACCHVNDLGNQMMAEAIVSSILLHEHSALRNTPSQKLENR
jgi:hypothetical protein